jgi:hypothetical protein
LIERMAQSAFPRARVLGAEALTGGMRNAHFKIHLDRAPGLVVLRVYEHDPSLCRKEVDLLCLASRSVPVPEVLYAQPEEGGDAPPYALLRYIEGIPFRSLARSGDRAAITQAAHSAGATLALLRQFNFSHAGWLGPGPQVAAPLMEGGNATPRFIDACLASANFGRLDKEARLVHGDFGKTKSTGPRRWRGMARRRDPDWEFAVSGTPLIDVGHFLRYERPSRATIEPHFSTGYIEAGGELPREWRQLSRMVDLVALCVSLTHDILPQPVSDELVELVLATVESRAQP